MISVSDEKWWPFFSDQGTGGSPTGPDPENRVGDQDIGNPSRPVSSGFQVPGEPGHCRARTRPPWWPSRGLRFSFRSPSIAPAEMSNTPLWLFALWKIINEEDAVLIPKNWGENFSSGFFHSGFFWGVVSRYAATPMLVALSVVIVI